MKHLPALFALLLVALLSITTGVGGSPTVHAQDALPAPVNVIVSDGENPGEVVVTWDAVPDAGYYRVGWVSYNDYLEVTGRGRPWSEAFVFVDVANIGQTSHAITRLEPGVLHAFRVASNATEYGQPSFSQWTLFTPPAPWRSNLSSPRNRTSPRNLSNRKTERISTLRPPAAIALPGNAWIRAKPAPGLPRT